jgi:hypothetical protein
MVRITRVEAIGVDLFLFLLMLRLGLRHRFSTWRRDIEFTVMAIAFLWIRWFTARLGFRAWT